MQLWLQISHLIYVLAVASIITLRSLGTGVTAVIGWLFRILAPNARRTRVLLAATAGFAALSVSNVGAWTGAALEAFHGVEAADAGEARSVFARQSRATLAAVADVAARTLAADWTALCVLTLRSLEAGWRIVAAHWPFRFRSWWILISFIIMGFLHFHTLKFPSAIG
jgi:hypothetical protein